MNEFSETEFTVVFDKAFQWEKALEVRKLGSGFGYQDGGVFGISGSGLCSFLVRIFCSFCEIYKYYFVLDKPCVRAQLHRKETG